MYRFPSTFPDPGAHSLMVRRAGTTAPFVALHDACFEAPVAVGLRMLPGDAAVAAEVTHADGGRRLAVYESGSGPAGWRLKGRFGVVEFDPLGRLQGLALIRGTELRYAGLHFLADREVSLSVTCDDRGARLVSSPPVGYETLEGLPVYATGQDTAVWIAISEASSPTGREIRERHVRLPGQTVDGPVPVDIRW